MTGRPLTFAEAADAYLAEYYRLLSSAAHALHLRSFAEGFALLADATGERSDR